MNQHPLAALLHINPRRLGDRRPALAVRTGGDPGKIVGQDRGIAIDLHARVCMSENMAFW